METTKELLTTRETAKLLGLSELTVYKLTYRKQIPFIRIGRTKRFDRAKLLAWIDANAYDTISIRK
jgi:excisionase family DNA binding protein